MDATSYHDIKSALRQLYLSDPRPWLVGFSGGKDSTLVASLPPEPRALEFRIPNSTFCLLPSSFPPPNRVFRWCTQRLKIDPVTAFVNQRMGHWGELCRVFKPYFGEAWNQAIPIKGGPKVHDKEVEKIPKMFLPPASTACPE